jgi:hypothetical protein
VLHAHSRFRDRIDSVWSKRATTAAPRRPG